MVISLCPSFGFDLFLLSTLIAAVPRCGRCLAANRWLVSSAYPRVSVAKSVLVTSGQQGKAARLCRPPRSVEQGISHANLCASVFRADGAADGWGTRLLAQQYLKGSAATCSVKHRLAPKVWFAEITLYAMYGMIMTLYIPAVIIYQFHCSWWHLISFSFPLLLICRKLFCSFKSRSLPCSCFYSEHKALHFISINRSRCIPDNEMMAVGAIRGSLPGLLDAEFIESVFNLL